MWYAVPMRRVRLILALLLIGAIVNVLVAWACARWGTHHPKFVPGTYERLESCPAVARVYLDDPEFLGRFVKGPEDSTLQILVFDSWTCTRVVHARVEGVVRDEWSRAYCSVKFGWPFRTLAYESQGENWQYERLDGLRGGWPAPDAEPTLWWSWLVAEKPDNVMPLLPLPVGFVANMVCYAAVACVSFATARMLLQRSRRLRGRCAGCGYPQVPVGVCPECGNRTG